MNLWQMPNGEYRLTPLGRGHRPHIMALYLGTMGDLANKLRKHGRETVEKRLPGLPPTILDEAEMIAERQRRTLAAMDRVATVSPLSDWDDDEQEDQP